MTIRVITVAMMLITAAAQLRGQDTDDPVAKARNQRAAREITAAAARATADANVTSGSAVHTGKLTPVSEAEQIEKAVQAAVIPGTDIRVGYKLEVAAAWYDHSGGVLSWKDPAMADTNHVMVTVQDASDLRVIPGCKVTASFTDTSGKELASSSTLAFTWSPEFYYYGGNVGLPETTSSMSLSVRIEPPEFRRLDKSLGGFFPTAVSHTFSNVVVSERTKHDPSQRSTEPERGIILEGRHPAITPTPYPGSRVTTGGAEVTRAEGKETSHSGESTRTVERASRTKGTPARKAAR